MSSSLASLSFSSTPPLGATWRSLGENPDAGVQLLRALAQPDPKDLLDLMRTSDLPEFSLMWKVEEPVEHHPEGNVGLHMELVMARAFELSSSLPEARQLRVRMMALTHDLGKVVTGSQRPSGRGHWVVQDPTRAARHPSHDYLGIDLVFSLFRRLSLPAELLDCCAQFANYHQAIHQLCSRSGQLGRGSVALATSLMITPKGDRFGLKAWRLALKESDWTADVAMSAQSDAQGRAFPMEQMNYPQADLFRRLYADCQSHLPFPLPDPVSQDVIQRISASVRQTLKAWEAEHRPVDEVPSSAAPASVVPASVVPAGRHRKNRTTGP